ncbi:PIN-like domain-containing protein [Moritella sp. Urea-trap-13]|uniref:PIN-like domain-containing protein n=1 Tax=Moritella sp. Urea-trap-13 TaxID=2058327 RepID=UPI000C34B6A3|nr:PIN-like domain-containing protein [Moritella sp. Urea-trap-13]PKH07045.1 hypothetical protein CXF93_14310 [Moritella sp. Urea-trap-13]
MKSKFPGYIDNYLENNILNSKKVLVSFDTNILLNLYRYEKSISADIISQIRSLKRNKFFDIWLPHQVALEFNLQRKATFKKQERAIHAIEDEFKSFKKTIEGLSKIGGKNSEVFPLKKELGVHFDTIGNIIKDYLPKTRSQDSSDPVINNVYDIFNGVVGDSYSQEDMANIEREGEFRFSNNIPPGYDDEGKEIIYSYSGVKINAKYGDYILWKQLIDKASQEQLTVVLVTGDVKSDWQSKEYSRVRPDLITEFKLKTGQDFYALTLPDFQRFFDSKLKRKLSDKTTNEMIELTAKDNSGWLNEILSAFEHFDNPLTLKEIYKFIASHSDRDLPPSWEVIIRRTVYNHCSDVSAYLGKKDLFEKISSGYYRLR